MCKERALPTSGVYICFLLASFIAVSSLQDAALIASSLGLGRLATSTRSLLDDVPKQGKLTIGDDLLPAYMASQACIQQSSTLAPVTVLLHSLATDATLRFLGELEVCLLLCSKALVGSMVLTDHLES